MYFAPYEDCQVAERPQIIGHIIVLQVFRSNN